MQHGREQAGYGIQNGQWTQDTEHIKQDAGSRIQDTGYGIQNRQWTQDTEHSTQDAGYGIC